MDHSHGVTYTVQNVSTKPLSVVDIDPGIEYVYIYWVDLSNTRRCRVVPIEYFRRLMASKRPGVNVARVVPALVYLNIPDGFSGVGEQLYALDKSSLRKLHGVGQRRVLGILGNFEEKTPTQDGRVEVAHCPRTMLKRITDEIKTQSSVEFLVGFESEFFLLLEPAPTPPSSSTTVTAASLHQFSTTAGFTSSSAPTSALFAIADALRASGIQLQMIHPEAGPGQYEVVTAPLTPLEAADALVYTREIITQVSATFGLKATFAPRPWGNTVGSSTHAHVSVHFPSSLGTKQAADLSGPEKSFLAGLLDHLPAVCAFTLPTYASYSRVVDGVWSGGTYVSWGTESRECPVRLTNATSPSSRNFELRFIDGTANPYLALAAILGAAKRSLIEMEELTVQNCDVIPPAEMGNDERTAKGVLGRLPRTIAGARDNLRADTHLCEVLGQDAVRVYLAVSETLEKSLNRDDETEAEKLKRLVDYY